MELIFDSKSEEQTRALGQRLAQVVQPGTVIALAGNLGAGKTRLTQAFAIAMGVSADEIRSPTFVLIHEYQGRLPIFHFDTYRLNDEEEWLELGVDEILASDGVCIIEWASRVAEYLPADRINIEISVTGEVERQFRIQADGPTSGAMLVQLKSDLTTIDKEKRP